MPGIGGWASEGLAARNGPSCPSSRARIGCSIWAQTGWCVEARIEHKCRQTWKYPDTYLLRDLPPADSPRWHNFNRLLAITSRRSALDQELKCTLKNLRHLSLLKFSCPGLILVLRHAQCRSKSFVGWVGDRDLLVLVVDIMARTPSASAKGLRRYAPHANDIAWESHRMAKNKSSVGDTYL